METMTFEGVEYVGIPDDTGGDCSKCAFQTSTFGCIAGCRAGCASREKDVYWVRKEDVQKQVEVSQFFGQPITRQIEMFPETLVTFEEDEAFEEMERKAHKQVGGDHYFNAIQPWDIIRAWDLNYWEGNIVKYVLRHKGKNKAEDLAKARHYLDYLIENYDELFPVSE